MSRPKLPAFFGESVEVKIPKVNVVIALVGIPLTYAGLFATNWIALSIGVGFMGVMPIFVGVHWLTLWRWRRKTAHWPKLVQVEVNEDGERIAFVTTASGDVTSLVLPEGYDPADDGGEWFMRQIAPDLAAEVFDKGDARIIGFTPEDEDD